MSRILTIHRQAVEKSWIFLVFVSLLSIAVGAERLPTSPVWNLSPDERDQAVIHLKKRWGRDRSSFSVARQLSELLFLQGRREEAVRTLLSTHEVTSSLAEQKKIQGQVRVLSRAFVTTEGMRHYQAGINALVSGNWKSALSWFEKVLLAEGPVLDALVKKGQTQTLLGQSDSAAETFRAALWLNPFEPEVRLWLGHVLLLRGEKHSGIQELSSAWAVASAEQRARPHWRAWMGEGLFFNGRSAAARALVLRDALKSPSQWTTSSGWTLGALAQFDSTHQSRVKVFLNLFPSAYVRLVGASGLDAEAWNPARLAAGSPLSQPGDETH